MTNGEKFKEVFGFGADGSRVIAVNATWWDCEFQNRKSVTKKEKEGNMSECCKNCKRRLDLKMSDYSQGGCRDYELGGYICLAFVNEGKAIWMTGQNEYTGFCECFIPKEES